MFARSFRPRLEALDGRVLPSGTPTLSISDVSLTEGQSGPTAFVFTVSLSEASSRRVAVNYETAIGTAWDVQSSSHFGPTYQDYNPASGKLTFERGETTKTITVLVNGDTSHEEDENFRVNLSRAQGAAIADGSGTGWILNDAAAVPPDDGDDGYGGWEWNDPYWYISP